MIPADLAAALRLLLHEGLEDHIYDVRERELLGWDGPRVKRYSAACEVVKQYAMPLDDFKAITDEDLYDRLVNP